MRRSIGIVVGIALIFGGVMLEGGHIAQIASLPDLAWILGMLVGYTAMVLPTRSFFRSLKAKWQTLSPVLAKGALVCGLILFALKLIVVFENLDELSKSMVMLGQTVSPVALSLLLYFILSRFSEPPSTLLPKQQGSLMLGILIMVFSTALCFVTQGFHFSSALQITAFILAFGTVLIGWLCSLPARKWTSLIEAGAWSALFGSLFGTAHVLEHFDKPEIIGPGLAVSLVAVIYGGLIVFVGSGLALKFEKDTNIETVTDAMAAGIAKLYVAALILIGIVALTLSALALGKFK